METLAASSSDESSEVVESANDNGIPPGDTRNVGLVDSGVPGESPEAGGKKAFRAAGTLIFPGLDRGRTLWEEDNYQSSLVTKTVPVPMGGFFTNGVAGTLHSLQYTPYTTRFKCLPPGVKKERKNRQGTGARRRVSSVVYVVGCRLAPGPR